MAPRPLMVTMKLLTKSKGPERCPGHGLSD